MVKGDLPLVSVDLENNTTVHLRPVVFLVFRGVVGMYCVSHVCAYEERLGDGGGMIAGVRRQPGKEVGHKRRFSARGANGADLQAKRKLALGGAFVVY